MTQDYMVLIDKEFTVTAEQLCTQLSKMLNDETHLGRTFRIAVEYDHQWEASTCPVGFSNAAKQAHDESNLTMTAWCRRGPGWSADSWLYIAVRKIAAEDMSTKSSTDGDEILALHRKITALEKELKERDESAALHKNKKLEEKVEKLESQAKKHVDGRKALEEAVKTIENDFRERLEDKEAEVESLLILVKEYEQDQEEKEMKENVTSTKNGGYTGELEAALDFLGYSNVVHAIKFKEGVE